MLTCAGCVVSGPVPRLGEALDAVHRETFDAAVLDVNLAGDRIDPVADLLSRQNVPFVFVTGYGAAVYAERPRLSKAFKMADLLDTLSSVVAPPSASA
jgi:hypothetical protein